MVELNRRNFLRATALTGGLAAGGPFQGLLARSAAASSHEGYGPLQAVPDIGVRHGGRRQGRLRPAHYTTPEGSYATQPDGSARIKEFRRMVQGLNKSDLRVIMDVVYNHTAAAGQAPTSVLDKVVPGYYQRLSLDGAVETSTCCANTATEHAMMGKLMVDSVVTWARD